MHPPYSVKGMKGRDIERPDEQHPALGGTVCRTRTGGSWLEPHLDKVGRACICHGERRRRPPLSAAPVICGLMKCCRTRNTKGSLATTTCSKRPGRFALSFGIELAARTSDTLPSCTEFHPPLSPYRAQGIGMRVSFVTQGTRDNAGDSAAETTEPLQTAVCGTLAPGHAIVR